MNKNKTKQTVWITILVVSLCVILLNMLSTRVYERLDLTKEGRYTLTEATEELLYNTDDVIYFKVFLDGEFPAGITRLKNATKDILDEFRSYGGSDIQYDFFDPLEGIDNLETKKKITEELVGKGIRPERLIEQGEAYSEKVFFPYALAVLGGREYPIPLLEAQMNKGPQETIQESISLLEYKFANAVQKLQRPSREEIAFLEGHGELNNYQVASVGGELSQFYNVSRLNLKEQLVIPQNLDLLIVAKPTQKFDEPAKFKLDQYIMNGGKVLWLIDNLIADIDSLRPPTNSFVAIPHELNLQDLLFKYGVRINDNLIQDMQCNPIPLAVSVDANGNANQFDLFNWFYHPVFARTNNEHPVSRNLGAIAGEFASSLDTIKTKGAEVKKEFLLTSSKYSKALFSPVKVDVNIVKQEPDASKFTKSHLPVAIALEGKFVSVFKNRLPQETMEMINSMEEVTFKEKSEDTKMIVIGDGDMIKNDIDGRTGQPFPLGYYKYTKKTFDNQQFIINSVEWLLDDSDVMTARSKDIKLRLLDSEKIKDEKTKWQLINIVAPLIFLILFGLIFTFLRKRKFAKQF